MTKLRKFAAGKPCMLRMPGVCNFNEETTVLAHIRRGGTAGVGMKPPDMCAIWACSNCHDLIDQRNRRGDDQYDSDILRALCQQLEWYEKHEVIGVLLP